MSKIISVYLSGPMYKSKNECFVWRDEIIEYLNNWSAATNEVQFNILNPCDRWFDDRTVLRENASWVIQLDKMEIRKSDVVIVNATDHGWGTPMEQYIAYESGKLVITFTNNANGVFPIWAKAHSHIQCKYHLNAAKWLCEHAKEIARTI